MEVQYDITENAFEKRRRSTFTSIKGLNTIMKTLLLTFSISENIQNISMMAVIEINLQFK